MKLDKIRDEHFARWEHIFNKKNQYIYNYIEVEKYFGLSSIQKRHPNTPIYL